MTYQTDTPTRIEERCERGIGDITEVGGQHCRTTPTFTRDRLDKVEALCIFPYHLDGKEYNECTLTEIKDFSRPRFVCPIRTIKNRDTNYTIADVDTNYCPTDGPVNNTFNGELELDPESDDCGNPLFSGRPAFATCKNTCPGGEVSV